MWSKLCGKCMRAADLSRHEYIFKTYYDYCRFDDLSFTNVREEKKETRRTEKL